MSLRKFTWLLTIPALLVLSGFLGWWWLLHTESGARWILEKAISASPAPIEADRISGDLSSGLRLEGLRFEGAAARIETGTLELAVEIGLFPIAVDIAKLHLLQVRVQAVPQASDKPSSGKLPETFEPPFPLAFRDIRISGIEYLDSAGEEVVVIDSIEAAGSVDQSLVLDRLAISAPADQLELSGNLMLTAPFAADLKFNAGGRLVFNGSLAGDTDSARIIIDATSHEAKVIGTVSRLLDQPSWNLEISTSALHWPLDSEAVVATISSVEIQTDGIWPDFHVDLSANLDIQELKNLQLEASGTGTNRNFMLQALTLKGPGLSLDATGVMGWEDMLHLGVTASLKELDPRIWLTDWPESHPVGGDFEMEWESGSLAIRNFELAVAGTSFSAQGQAKLDLESDIVDADFSWKAARWPIDSAVPTVASESGTLRMTGQPDNWEVSGDFDLQADDFPPGHLQLSGNGDTESMNLSIREAETLGGTLAGIFSWNWTGKQPFEASLSARRVNISPLFPDYPGILNARLMLDGEIEPFRLGIVIEELDGVIREYPVTGRGGITLEQGRIFASGVHLSSGGSTLELDGSLYEPGGMNFSAGVDSLSRFLPDYDGAFSAQGNISLNPKTPRASIVLSGSDLKLGAVKIEQIDSRRISGASEEPESEIQFSGLVINQQPIESITLRLGGAKPLESMGITARMGGADIGMELRGSINDWSDPAGSGWRGELSELRINHQGQLNLTQDEPAGIEWTPSQFMLEPVCLSSTGAARLCMASTMKDSGDLSISAEIVSLPASLLELFSDTELRFSQVLNGTLDWSQTAANGRSGTARFEISPGTIRLEDDDEVLLETGSGQFGFDLAGGTLQNGNLDLSIPGAGGVDVDFSVPDLSLGSESPVLGHVRVKFHSLAVLGPVFPLLDNVGGEVDVDLELTGSLKDPAFRGKASITNGTFSNLASGFSFSEINIAGNVANHDNANLQGTFRAGQGTGTISAGITFANLASPVMELQLKGESLTLIDVPDLNIIANPDVVLGWRDGALEINGRLFIPKARLAPSYLPRQSIRQSEDVVIIAGELEESEDSDRPTEPLRIRGTLEVELGKQAQIELDVAKVHVFGTTRFKWQDDLLPLADGNFDIRGDIQAYGQSLKITQGRISFPSIPANNPHLNIRAERSIYGNSQIQKAGLMVAGTVKRPIIEAYTVPMTNKDRAQTLLVTGSDFNYEQGVGAVAVGAYVLPRLYISYGIGVFEEGNVISARYDLGKRFGVKVTSGQKDTGVDLNYTIER